MSLNPTSTHTISEKPLKSILPIFPSVSHSILSITSREKPKILNLPFLTDEEEKEKKNHRSDGVRCRDKFRDSLITAARGPCARFLARRAGRISIAVN